MNPIINSKTFKEQNENIVKYLNCIIKDYEDDEDVDFELEILDWIKSDKNLDTYLKDYVFKEVDQIVVPTLNLKAAKKIICRNEKQKKKLRKMGFIEDRISIKNLKADSF